SSSNTIPQSVINTQFGTKLILLDSLNQAAVFSLPGKLPGSTTKSSVDPPSIVSGNPLPTSAYPNPSNGQMRISYKLPLGVTTGELVIYTADGVEVKRLKVGEGFNDILVTKSDLSSGSYFYKLVTEKGDSEAKKLIILK
ncbi:MAG: T9SS type A sorting domain-containing protein, partial [Ignavibacteriota bacterium]